MTDPTTPLSAERLDELERLVADSRKRWPHAPGMSTDLVLALTPDVVFALVAAAREMADMRARIALTRVSKKAGKCDAYAVSALRELYGELECGEHVAIQQKPDGR